MRRINNFWFEYTFTANKLKYQIILIKSHIIYDIPEFFKLKNRPFCQNNHPSKSLPTFRSLLRHCLYHSIITTNIIDFVFHILNLLRRRQGNVHDKIVENMSIIKKGTLINLYRNTHTHIPTKKKTTIKNVSNDRLKK